MKQNNAKLEVKNTKLQKEVSTLKLTLSQNQQELKKIQEKYCCLMSEQNANRQKINKKLGYNKA